MHVLYISLYISLASSATEECEMTTFCVVYRTWTTTRSNVSHFGIPSRARQSRISLVKYNFIFNRRHSQRRRRLSSLLSKTQYSFRQCAHNCSAPTTGAIFLSGPVTYGLLHVKHRQLMFFLVKVRHE